MDNYGTSDGSYGNNVVFKVKTTYNLYTAIPSFYY